MRVAHFLASMKPEHDGVSRVIDRLRREFSQSSESSHYFISSEVPDQSSQNLELTGSVTPEMIAVPSVPFPLSSGYRISISSVQQMTHILKRVQPHVIHLHSPCSLGWVAAAAAAELGIPMVATYHTHFPSYMRYYGLRVLKPWVWRYLGKLYSTSQGLIVPSQSTLAELKAKKFQNLIHIPHGVDTRGFSPRYRSEEWRRSVSHGRKTLVTFVGRLVWEKNLQLLAEAYQQLRHLKSIQFVVVGEGPARGELQRLMPEAHFTGFLGAGQLPIAYASSDVFAFPSLTETFGNVTVEAMASGLPAVCLARGGSYDIVQNGVNGYLVGGEREGWSQQFAAAIRNLALSPAHRASLSQAALVSAALYRWEDTASQYLHLYDRVAFRSES